MSGKKRLQFNSPFKSDVPIYLSLAMSISYDTYYANCIINDTCHKTFVYGFKL